MRFNNALIIIIYLNNINFRKVPMKLILALILCFTVATAMTT